MMSRCWPPGSCRTPLCRLTSPCQTPANDISALMGHDWPGNLQELRNVAERR